MPKLTDDEVGRILRETFAEQEELLDRLPEATTPPVRRRLSPLLAAVAVLVILGGAVSSAGIIQQREPQPAAQPTVGSKVQVAGGELSAAKMSVLAEVSGVAMAELLKWERPATGWPLVKILDSPYRSAANPLGAGLGFAAFTAADRQLIESHAGAPVEWVKSRPTDCSQADGTPYVTLGSVTVESGQKPTIGLSIWRSCLDARWLTYSLENVGSIAFSTQSSRSLWRVTGTVGPISES